MAHWKPIEYGLIAALISVVMVSLLVTLGPMIKASFAPIDNPPAQFTITEQESQ